ncbi:hypothetical protein QJS10_CPB12g00208 [Acorus calamus]|uniref:Uncharacterized protein n=1 Tax=Acorus calamus TaxID=4465 RepID=A0AAV9DMC8_ACOCL|nr:hypothetical protein QJS10_CPB12g00208 [Acorus calamus]
MGFGDRWLILGEMGQQDGRIHKSILRNLDLKKTVSEVEAVSEAFVNFQLRMYGIKTQVHETPDKKKRRRKIHVIDS